LEEKQPWLILVYDNSELSSQDQLSGFWNEFIVQNSFANYGSMELKQFNKGLAKYSGSLSNAPFLVSALPNGRFLLKTLRKEMTISKRLNKVVYSMAKKSIKYISYDQFLESHKTREKRTKVFLVCLEKINVSFFFMSKFLENEIDFYFINPADRQKTAQKMGDKSIQAIITPSEASGLKRQNYLGYQN
jgi:hypothetical protein